MAINNNCHPHFEQIRNCTQPVKALHPDSVECNRLQILSSGGGRVSIDPDAIDFSMGRTNEGLAQLVLYFDHDALKQILRAVGARLKELTYIGPQLKGIQGVWTPACRMQQ